MASPDDDAVLEDLGQLWDEAAPRLGGLVAALARCQAKFPAIVKSHPNPAFKDSQYADVADVLAAVRPVLAAEGIVVTQATRVGDEGGVVLVTSLLLEGDPTEEIDSQFPLYVAGLTAQQVGSLMTYMRRYQLCAILGVHPVGDDDDGNLAATAQTAAPRLAPPRAEPFNNALAMSQPDKPLAAMTMRELLDFAQDNGVAVSGSKSDIVRTLEPLVRAASGDEPWPVEGEGGSTGGSRPDALTSPPSHPEPDAIPFNPVVAGSVRKGVNSSMKADT